MTYRHLLFVVVVLYLTQVDISAQPTANLTAYFPMDNCPIINDEAGPNQNAQFSGGGASCPCGVRGTGLEFDGLNDNLLFLGQINNLIGTTNFTFSFYFKPYPAPGTMDIFSKRENCDLDRAFAVKYNGGSSRLTVLMAQDADDNVTVDYQLPRLSCWYLVTIAREGPNTLLYINGELVKSGSAPHRLNLKNNAPLYIAGSPCLASTDYPFRGMIDEFRMYSRALTPFEIAELNFKSDKIYNQDTLIFLGGGVPIELNAPCATKAQWTPTNGIADPFSFSPILSPDSTTTYTVTFTSDFCVSQDVITVKVVDPDKLECDNVLLPSAFTPNGDGRNEIFYISNPYVIDDLIEFEIFDRWGNRTFKTDDLLQGWDGNFNGSAVNPGVYLYRIRFICNGEEKSNIGKVTVIR